VTATTRLSAIILLIAAAVSAASAQTSDRRRQDESAARSEWTVVARRYAFTPSQISRRPEAAATCEGRSLSGNPVALGACAAIAPSILSSVSPGECQRRSGSACDRSRGTGLQQSALPARIRYQHAGHVVEGVVKDRTGVLPGAEVRLVELDRFIVTDAHGHFRFVDVPAGSVTLTVHLEGFGSARCSVSVPIEAPLTVHLDPALRYAEEVVVSAAPWAVTQLESARQIDQVAAVDVRRERVASLGDALGKIAGVSFIPTGNALGTPVIRGISENRIRVLHDGIPLNHQQFSWRHAPNVEPAFAERIELVRGPSTVLHGPEAMGGIINVIHAPLPFAADGGRVIHGEVTVGACSSTAEWAGQGRLEGAFGGFGWRADAIRRQGDDITTPRGPLSNTDFEQTNGSLLAAYSGRWGSARTRWHHWENDAGFFRPEGFRLAVRDDLVAADLHLATRAGVVEVVLGRQLNRREAFEIPGAPATLDLHLATLTARAALQHRNLGVLRGQLGVEYQAVDNDTRLGALVPDYRSDNLAVMAFEEARLLPTGEPRFDRVILSAGVRGDVHGLDVSRPGERRTTHYGALSGAIGVVVRLREPVSLAGNLGRGWRPPSTFELYADGVHGGVAAYQVGNPALDEESNTNAELSVKYRDRRAEGTLSVYRNAFDNYVYLADAGRTVGLLPVFVHRQAGARFTGLEATGNLILRPWLKLSGAWTMTNTCNVETGRLLPQTPADRLLLGVQLQVRQLGPLQNASAGVDVAFVGDGEISGPDEPLGTPTSGYEVCDLRAGFVQPLGRMSIDVALTIRNLFDREYRDFLWSYKPYAPNPGRDVRLTATCRF
jgi:outer membrane receptor protein involved in Fe transport